MPDWRRRPGGSGSVAHERGISKAGNPQLRTTMMQLAWLWVRHQLGSILTLWFHQRTQLNGGRVRKVLIVALARKLLIAFWKYVTAGVVLEGAEKPENKSFSLFNLPGPDRLRRIQVSGPKFGLA